MATVFVIGMIFTIAVFVKDSRRTFLNEKGQILRNEQGGGEYDVKLRGEMSGSREEYDLHIEERIPSDQELEVMADEANRLLDPVMRNGNPFYPSVSEDMKFPVNMEGYPFTLRWSSSDEEKISHTGKVIRDPEDRQEYEVIIETVFVFGEFRKSYQRKLFSVSRDYGEEELRLIKLDKGIDSALSESRNSNVITLPETVDGQKVVYSEIKKNNGVLMILITFTLTAAVGMAVSFDERQSRKKRNDSLDALYPGFVEKVKLYMISGMTAKNTLFAIRDDVAGSGKKYELLYKELERTCNKYTNGVSEEKILSDLGNSCTETYRRFCFLLTVNLKQGNDKLMQLLDREVEKAFAMRRERAKCKGEEATVKLLFPMLIMLLIVLVIIMIPAYMKFN
ncbi:MAG: hypothetical protein K5888_00425 [Lachnospiraceae bacterium]|nr:hypothetical protein [Lachnospiraceae bacterium]